jgi:hypothetical protein
MANEENDINSVKAKWRLMSAAEMKKERNDIGEKAYETSSSVAENNRAVAASKYQRNGVSIKWRRRKHRHGMKAVKAKA